MGFFSRSRDRSTGKNHNIYQGFFSTICLSCLHNKLIINKNGIKRQTKSPQLDDFFTPISRHQLRQNHRYYDFFAVRRAELVRSWCGLDAEVIRAEVFFSVLSAKRLVRRVRGASARGAGGASAVRRPRPSAPSRPCGRRLCAFVVRSSSLVGCFVLRARLVPSLCAFVVRSSSLVGCFVLRARLVLGAREFRAPGSRLCAFVLCFPPRSLSLPPPCSCRPCACARSSSASLLVPCLYLLRARLVRAGSRASRGSLLVARFAGGSSRSVPWLLLFGSLVAPCLGRFVLRNLLGSS